MPNTPPTLSTFPRYNSSIFITHNTYGYVHPVENPSSHLKMQNTIKEEDQGAKPRTCENLINDQKVSSLSAFTGHSTVQTNSPPIPVSTGNVSLAEPQTWPIIPIPRRITPSPRHLVGVGDTTVFRNHIDIGGITSASSFTAIDEKNELKRKFSDDDNTRPSKKKGVKHDRTTVDVYIREAKTVNNFALTGLADHGKFIVIDEERFYNWVCSNLKDPKYKLVKASLLEKFDKSRRTNRVNPKDKEGPIPIKYLRIDKACRNGLDFSSIPVLEADLEHIERVYGTHNIRVYTHRDWAYLDQKYFIYEPTKKSSPIFSISPKNKLQYKFC
jgi:hypothetical protein